MLHLPILRAGRSYRSVQSIRVPHFRTKETFVELSEANSGLVRRDLLDAGQEAMRASLDAFSTMQLVEISARAADAFMNATLPAALPVTSRSGSSRTPSSRSVCGSPASVCVPATGWSCRCGRGTGSRRSWR